MGQPADQRRREFAGADQRDTLYPNVKIWRSPAADACRSARAGGDSSDFGASALPALDGRSRALRISRLPHRPRIDTSKSAAHSIPPAPARVPCRPNPRHSAMRYTLRSGFFPNRYTCIRCGRCPCTRNEHLKSAGCARAIGHRLLDDQRALFVQVRLHIERQVLGANLQIAIDAELKSSHPLRS